MQASLQKILTSGMFKYFLTTSKLVTNYLRMYMENIPPILDVLMKHMIS
jgi:hypothetical protein